jgi:hypothetical protein
VHPIGLQCDGYVRAVVDDERNVSLLACLENRSRETQHVAGLRLFLAQLDQIDSGSS